MVRRSRTTGVLDLERKVINEQERQKAKVVFGHEVERQFVLVRLGLTG